MWICCAELDNGLKVEPEPAPESWSGDSLMLRAAQCLKKDKADKLNDDEIDDCDWTCQGCLVRAPCSAWIVCYLPVVVVWHVLRCRDLLFRSTA